MNFANVNTIEEAISILRTQYKGATANRTQTVIAARKNGEWIALAYKASHGWKTASLEQQRHPLNADQYPTAPPSAMEIYCKVAGQQGGTIHQAIADLAKRGEAFKEQLLSALFDAKVNEQEIELLMDM